MSSVSLPQFHRRLMNQPRIFVGGNHSYLTHEPHHAFLTRTGWENPVLTLRSRLGDQIEQHQARLESLQPHDVLHLLDIRPLCQDLDTLDSWIQDL